MTVIGRKCLSPSLNYPQSKSVIITMKRPTEEKCKRGQYLANLSPLPGVLCVDLTGVVLFNLLSVRGFFLLVGVGVSMVELSFGLLKWAGVGGII